MLPTDLTSLLVYLAGGVLAGAIAPLLNNLDAFKVLPSQAKVVIVVFLNTVIAVGAMALQQFLPKETVAQLNPFFAVALNSIYLGFNQLMYLLSKPADEPVALKRIDLE